MLIPPPLPGPVTSRRSAIAWIFWSLVLLLIALAIIFASGKVYQHWDRDPDRGAIALDKGAFGESYATPVYLDQGWDAADSLWFYNTTQGSALLPYDFFLALEQHDSNKLFRANRNMDGYRYLPQKPTFFNPDGLPVGFARESYQGKDYMGFTCAACHTSQINYRGQAIRIDGGPAMADMAGFLAGLEKALTQTRDHDPKRQNFIDRVLALGNDYQSRAQVERDLDQWTTTVALYNTINQTEVAYGYGRLDAFGRIFNRVLRHLLNRGQLEKVLLSLRQEGGQPLLSTETVERVLAGVSDTLLNREEFRRVLERLQSTKPGYPGLSSAHMLQLRDRLFNEPNAPVSYPFLWDVSHSDYVQWNGLASNAGMGPLGRNAGEVMGVFARLDWQEKKPGFSLSAYLTGQEKKRAHIDFQSSIDLVNLQRLEAHLKSLTSPQWPEEILGAIDRTQAKRGERIYTRYCQSCHQVIERDAWDRVVLGRMIDIDTIGTDPAMARNSIEYRGFSGNFAGTYQMTGVGPLVMEAQAPVVQILAAATTGVVATPDPDKGFLRRRLDWLYTLGLSFFDNDVQYSLKTGRYRPDTTAEPYRSLLAYKARPLNGIWATAPYLHNGSVPTLYDLLLPVKRPGDPEDGEYRPEHFRVGSREFDPKKVGFKSQGYSGFEFRTQARGDLNQGHEYAAGRTPQLNGKVLPPLTEAQRWDLIEYLKTL